MSKLSKTIHNLKANLKRSAALATLIPNELYNVFSGKSVVDKILTILALPILIPMTPVLVALSAVAALTCLAILPFQAAYAKISDFFSSRSAGSHALECVQEVSCCAHELSEEDAPLHFPSPFAARKRIHDAPCQMPQCDAEAAYDHDGVSFSRPMR
jgi:hypothetical protein